jgi:glyoxylase-like metal-dependent hydrolase (beta-lactamase superfamily II)/rhodanese-related sulfurtransferase
MKSQAELTADDLRDALEKGTPWTVLDVRPQGERAEWWIPESRHVDVYDDLWRGDTARLRRAAESLPKDVPVVTVCAMGQTSQLAAKVLGEMGFQAYSLSGGMRAWSESWNMAGVAAPSRGEGGVTILQVRRTGKGCLSYVVASGEEAAVVDASLDPAIYIGLARERGWTIRHVLDTHIHADHLSRGRALAGLAAATLWLPESQRARFPHRALRDGETLALGATTVRALRTPGHTLESTCYFVDDRWLLTGDTLFLNSVGRPDLEAGAREARARAIILHESLRALLALDSRTLVLPGHTSEPIPFDNAVVGAALGAVREAIKLPADAAAFAESVLPRIPPTPPNHQAILAMNEAGEFPDGDVTSLEAGANRCAIS